MDARPNVAIYSTSSVICFANATFPIGEGVRLSFEVQHSPKKGDNTAQLV